MLSWKPPRMAGVVRTHGHPGETERVMIALQDAALLPKYHLQEVNAGRSESAAEDSRVIARPLRHVDFAR